MSDKHRVLVVEDNDFVRMQIVKYLGDADFETVEAISGEDAYGVVFSRDDIDLVIVDVRMEPVGGFEFIRTIRGRDIHVPVILVTGDQTPDLLERAGQWGVNAVLMKPVEKDRLVKVVARTITSSKRLA